MAISYSIGTLNAMENNNGKQQNYIKSTKLSSPTRSTGTSSKTPIGDSFMYKEKIITVRMFTLVFKERISYISLITPFIAIDSLQEIANQWEDLKFNY